MAGIKIKAADALDTPVADMVAAQQAGIEPQAAHYGIDETRQMIEAVTDIAVFAATHKSLNVITLAEAGFTMLPVLARAIDGVGAIPAEMLDLDNAEREQLILAVGNRVAQYCTPDSVPEIALKSFEAALHLAQLGAMIKRHVAAGQTPITAALAEARKPVTVAQPDPGA